MSPNRRRTVGASASESSDQLRLFACTIYGLEHHAARELASRGHRVLGVRKRQVLLASPKELVGDRPRTVDDLLVQAAEAPDPGPRKDALSRLRTSLSGMELDFARSLFGCGEAVFSVSASITGRRTYNRYDLEEAIGSVLAERLGARFSSRRGGLRPPVDSVEWRALLSPAELLLGLRGRRPPLHRRAWKHASVPGSLHPPVAAAMSRLADIEPGMTVLDPCCGAGTVLIEAREQEPRARFAGGDLDSSALAAAMPNARHRPEIAWALGDAVRLAFPAGSVDRIVTNPAWGRQVESRASFESLLAEWRRVLAPDGRLVCLVPPELLRHFESRDGGWKVLETLQLSLMGRHPVIVVAAP